MFSPFSPAISPATKPPQPAFDTAAPPLPGPVSPPFDFPPPPPLSPAPSAPPVTSPVTTAPPTPSSTVPLPTNSAPPVTSPATPSPPTVSSTAPLPANSVPPVTSTVPLPTNSPPPVASPDIPAPPVLPSPSPESSHVPASSSPPNTSNEIPDSSTPSPPVMSLPPVMPLPSPLPPASQTPPFPPSTVAATPPTVTFSPPSTPTLPEVMPQPPPLPIPFTEPPLSSRPTPVSSPEVNLRPTSSSRSLPVAVEVQKPSGFNVSSGLIVGVIIGAIFFVFVLAIVSVLCRNRKKKKQKNRSLHHQKESSLPCVGSKGSHVIRVPSNPTLPPHLTEDGGLGGASDSVNSGSVRLIPNHAPSIGFGPVNGIFAYEELEVATKYFAESNLLGEGGFGYVYKGVLPCGKEIAVKQLKAGSQQGEREFQAEVETISRVHHKHLVELVGYCINRAERLLVYEFVPNNTLEFHLHGEGKTVMEWATRVKIALGSAKGLAYLHEDCNPAIIHRDIKTSNILLDFKFEAKVSDFGLAKIFPNTDSCITHLTTRVVGTFGYLAPEYASSGKLTDKSDVYSYGVMLLELITGRPPITAVGSRNESLIDWARPLLAQALQDGNFNNLVDPRLQKNYEADEMARMITCAAACVRHSARLRPRMSQIVGALEGLVSLTDIVGDITPGHTTLYSWSDNSDYDASQYQQYIRNFNLALSCQKYSSSGHSESTSAYGLYPSASSSEVQEAIRDRDQR